MAASSVEVGSSAPWIRRMDWSSRDSFCSANANDLYVQSLVAGKSRGLRWCGHTHGALQGGHRASLRRVLNTTWRAAMNPCCTSA